MVDAYVLPRDALDLPPESRPWVLDLIVLNKECPEGENLRSWFPRLVGQHRTGRDDH